MASRTARTAWNGTLNEGGGQVELSSSKVGTFDVSFPKRAADEAGGTTSPEELLAAALSSCYSMQFSGLLGAAGGNPVALDVSAEATFAADPAGGFHVPSIVLTVRGEVEGIDEATFLQVAEDAKATCPVSKALTGTTITLHATFEQ